MPSTKNLDPRQILRLLHSQNYPAQVAKALGVTRGAVHYWVKKLMKQGLIQIQSKGVMSFYTLTKDGLTFLTGSEETPQPIVTSEDYGIKYPILRHETSPVDWKKLGQPRNWVKLGFKRGGVQVVKTTKHVIIHPGQVKGLDPYEVLYYQSEICNRVVHWLESSLGMRLGHGKPIRRPGIQIKDPVAEYLSNFYTMKNDVGALDASPPSKEGHIEFWDPRYAKSALLAPMHLEMVLQELRMLSQGQSTQGQQIKKLIDSSILTTSALRSFTETINQLLPQRPTDKPLKGREEYVV